MAPEVCLVEAEGASLGRGWRQWVTKWACGASSGPSSRWFKLVAALADQKRITALFEPTKLRCVIVMDAPSIGSRWRCRQHGLKRWETRPSLQRPRLPVAPASVEARN